MRLNLREKYRQDYESELEKFASEVHLNGNIEDTIKGLDVLILTSLNMLVSVSNSFTGIKDEDTKTYRALLDGLDLITGKTIRETHLFELAVQLVYLSFIEGGPGGTFISWSYAENIANISKVTKIQSKDEIIQESFIIRGCSNEIKKIFEDYIKKLNVNCTNETAQEVYTDNIRDAIDKDNYSSKYDNVAYHLKNLPERLALIKELTGYDLEQKTINPIYKRLASQGRIDIFRWLYKNTKLKADLDQDTANNLFGRLNSWDYTNVVSICSLKEAVNHPVPRRIAALAFDRCISDTIKRHHSEALLDDIAFYEKNLGIELKAIMNGEEFFRKAYEIFFDICPEEIAQEYKKLEKSIGCGPHEEVLQEGYYKLILMERYSEVEELHKQTGIIPSESTITKCYHALAESKYTPQLIKIKLIYKMEIPEAIKNNIVGGLV